MMLKGHKIDYMRQCLTVAQGELDYMTDYLIAEPDVEEDYEKWQAFVRSHRKPNKALIADNLRNVARMAFRLAKELGEIGYEL